MSHSADVNGFSFIRDHGSGTPLLLLHGFMERAMTGACLPCRSTATESLRRICAVTVDQRILPAFRFADVARDILALLDRLGINRVKAIA